MSNDIEDRTARYRNELAQCDRDDRSAENAEMCAPALIFVSLGIAVASFAAHELGHPPNMRLWPHHSSQRSCHNQLTHYPRAYWSRNSRMSHDQLFEGCDPFHTARSLSGLPLLDVRIRSRDGPND
jgi:hypothetical protein